MPVPARAMISSLYAKNEATYGTAETLAGADLSLGSMTLSTYVALGFTDTGQSGSVSYRLCACADTAASAQFGAGATLQLTEY